MVTHVLIKNNEGKIEKKPVNYVTEEQAYAEEESKGNTVYVTWTDD